MPGSLPHTSETERALGQLRKKFIRNRLLEKKKKRDFRPEYSRTGDYFKATKLADSLIILLDLGYSPSQIVMLFATSAGLEQVEQILVNYETFLLEKRLGSEQPEMLLPVPLRNFFILCRDDEVLRQWVGASLQNIDPKTFDDKGWEYTFVKWLIAYSQPLKELVSLHLLDQAFSQKNSLRAHLLQILTVEDFEISISSFAKHVFRAQYGEDIRAEKASLFLILILKGRDQLRTSWSQRLRQLDWIMNMSNYSSMNYSQWEVYLVSHYLQGKGLSLTSSDLLATNFRDIAGHTRSSQERVTSDQRKEMFEVNLSLDSDERYTQIDRQESAQHPLSYLFGLYGVEVEAEFTSALTDFYNVLGYYVVTKGAGGSFEYSAVPVRRIETLQLLYEKLFASGFLDTFLVTDYSTHWNASVISKTLTQESLAILTLTGMVSQGRTTEGINKRLHSNDNGFGGYYEWKQGDLVYPETFLYGCQIWHSLMTAQRAYETATVKCLEHKGLLPTEMSNDEVLKELEMIFLESDLPIEDINQDDLPLTEEERRLAIIYLQFRQAVHSFFEQIDQELIADDEPAISTDVLLGSTAGMQQSTKWLMSVFPSLSSFITVDPLEGPSSNDRDIQQAFKVVSFATQKTREVMHQVQAVVAQAEEVYVRKLTMLAELILNKKFDQLVPVLSQILRRFPTDQELPPDFDQANVRRQLLMVLPIVKSRLQWMSEDPRLSPKKKILFEQAIALLPKTIP